MITSYRTWAGRVPSSWGVIPAGVGFSESKELARPDDPHLTPSQNYGVVTQDEYRDITGHQLVKNTKSAANMKHVEPDDFIISMASHLSGLERSPVAGKVSGDYRVLRPSPLYSPDYLGHLMKSRDVIQNLSLLTTEIRVGQRISFDRFSLLDLPLPPLETQRAIADYLDRETAEVDAMSADLDELEALLTERRGAVSTVLIGRLEGRSETRRVSLSVVADLISSNVDKKSREGELPVRLVNYTDVYYGDTLTSDADYMRATATPEQIGRVGVRDGDVIFTKDSETADDIGIPALVLNPDTDMVCGYHLTIARPRRELVNPRYLYWTLMSGQAKSHWEQVANGVTRFSIGSSATSGLPVLLPPLEVQRRVADEIDRETAEIDAMLADIVELRGLLAERRTAVIAAAVTGQIDVPTTQETTNG